MELVEKLKDCFDEMLVYKDLKKTNFFSSLSLPAFMRDWLLKKFEDEDGNLSPVYFGEMFTLSKSQCDPAEEFFQYVAASSATTFAIAR